jgi:hypothetical protein
MAFLDLFIINDDNEKKKDEPKEDVQKSFKSKFPSSGSATVEVEVKTEPITQNAPVMAAITPQNPACAPHMDKIMKLYEDGFNGLNLAGYDFFEFFQAVVKTGANNPSMYNMALTMAQAMDSSVSKESLVKQSQYYIDEIEKVYKTYVDNGNVKRQEALQAKGNEEASLSKDLSDINDEIARLTQLKSEKEIELSKIDSKYSPDITDIECKLMANDIAKERIIGTIKTVVDGINKNL